MPKTKTITSLKKLRATIGPLAPPRRSSRARHEVISKTEQDEMEEQLLAFDPEIDDLDPGDERDDDDDYLQSVPGRPAQFPTTWAVVYGKRVLVKGKGFCITCEEPGCASTNLYLDSKLKEIAGKSTPHGKPRRPPVCHKVSWAALEYVMLQMESKAGKKFNDDFRRRVCWEPSNLGPGHNACNASGQKTTAQNLSTAERKDAEAVVDRVMNAYNGLVWQ